MLDIAYAMGTQGGGAGAAAGGGSALSALFPLVLIFLVFYFLLIRPQQKQARDRQNMLSDLKKGDEIVTSGGLHGKITGITDQVITLEVADNVRVKVSRSFISGMQKDLMAKGAEKEKEKSS